MFGGDADRFAETEAVGLAQVDLVVAEVGLVDHEDDVLLRAAKAGRDLGVEGGEALQPVDDEEDQVGGLDGEIDLLLGGLGELGGRIAAF